MAKFPIKLNTSWKKRLGSEFAKPYFQKIIESLQSEYSNFTIYPKQSDIFRAFDLCPFQNVRVVILGQDPYHGPSEATGLCFAVNSSQKIPPSLRNIFKEIQSDLNIKNKKIVSDTKKGDEKKSGKEKSGARSHVNETLEKYEYDGDLSRFARQGVLLLNTTLTVRENSPASHREIGWNEFTDLVIHKISAECRNVVFLLWGNHAREKASLIDAGKHLVLEAQHPSPFSAYRGFFGCKHFSKTNQYLKKNGYREIDWE